LQHSVFSAALQHSVFSAVLQHSVFAFVHSAFFVGSAAKLSAENAKKTKPAIRILVFISLFV
jgi:hypothetical protein